MNVRELLDLIAERIGDDAYSLFIAMNDADNDGMSDLADELELQHSLLVQAQKSINEAIEAISEYKKVGET